MFKKIIVKYNRIIRCVLYFGIYFAAPLTAHAQECDVAQQFRTLAAVLPIPIGDCLSPEVSDVTTIRQQFTLGEFVMREADGLAGFNTAEMVWVTRDNDVQQIPLNDWLALVSTGPPQSVGSGENPSITVPAGVPTTTDPLAQAMRSIHRLRIGDGWGSAVSTSIGILTSGHLVSNMDYVELVTSDGELVLAKVTKLDEIFDLALLDAPLSAPLLEVPPSTKVMIEQDAAVLGFRSDESQANSFSQSGVVVKGRTRRSSGLQTIELDGQLTTSESGGALVSPDGQLLGLFSVNRRTSGDPQFAVAAETLQEFGAATASRTLVPRSQFASATPIPKVQAAPTLAPLPATATRAPTPISPPTPQPASTAPAMPTPDSKVIRREFFDSTETTLRLGQTGDYDFSVNDREYRIFRKASQGKYTGNMELSLLTTRPERDVTVKLTARLVGSETGRQIALACRTTDQGSQYRATISPQNRAFTIDKLISGQFFSQPVPWKQETAIEANPRERNTFEFSCIGSEFKLKINGKQVAAFTDIELPEGSAWFTASTWKEAIGDTDARFSNILVTRGP